MTDAMVCDDCAAVYRYRALGRREIAQCRRCGQVIGRGPAPSLELQAALALTALIVFAVANLAPIVVLEVGTGRTEATLLGAVAESWGTQPLVAALAFATGFAFPLAVIVLRLHVLLTLVHGDHVPAAAALARALRWFTRWSMVEVFTLAALVAVSRSNSIGQATPSIGLFAFGVLTVLMTAPQGSDDPAAHYAPAAPKRNLQACVAYLIAAAALYLPSNLLPVMWTRTPNGERGHTLMGGVIELWHSGAWDLAVIVFVASIVVPITKMVALTLLIVTASRASRWRQRARTRLYRLVDAVGHWSMLDVYIVVLLAGIVNFAPLVAVAPAPGLAAFGAVVVLTMLAAERFDPRLIWPRAHRG